MREKAAAGLIFIAGLMLIVAGVTGRLGDLLGAVFAPDQMQLGDQQIQSGGIAGLFPPGTFPPGGPPGGIAGLFPPGTFPPAGNPPAGANNGPTLQPGGGNRY